MSRPAADFAKFAIFVGKCFQYCLSQLARKAIENILGLAVSHPPPGIQNQPSFVGAASSVDADAAVYKAHLKVHAPHVELVDAIGMMVVVCHRSSLSVVMCLVRLYGVVCSVYSAR